MDVKNKVDKDVVENVVKEDKPTKPDADEKNTSYELGKSVGYLEGLFVAVKDTKTIAKSTCVGAAINIIFNIITIIYFGAIGAAISTMISAIVVWGIRIYKTRKIIDLNINYKIDFFSYFILIVQAFIAIIINRYLFLINITIFLFILTLNHKEITSLKNFIMKKVTK